MQKITAVPCGAVSSDRSQMGPLLYGRLSFSAENSPSLLNVFKNLLQILQVASCEIEKAQPQSWFCVRVCMLGFFSPLPFLFFSALTPPLSIFDPQDSPAAESADLVSLVVPLRPPGNSAAPSTQHRWAPKAIRWVGARRPGLGGNLEPLGSWGEPHGPKSCRESWGAREEGVGKLNLRPRQTARSRDPASLPLFPSGALSRQPGQLLGAALSPRRRGGVEDCLLGSLVPQGPSLIQEGDTGTTEDLAVAQARKLDWDISKVRGVGGGLQQNPIFYRINIH